MGLNMRFRHYAPNLSDEDRIQLVSACLLFDAGPQQAFEQVITQLNGAPKKRA
jgi:hypothetical protein